MVHQKGLGIKDLPIHNHPKRAAWFAAERLKGKNEDQARFAVLCHLMAEHVGADWRDWCSVEEKYSPERFGKMKIVFKPIRYQGQAPIEPAHTLDQHKATGDFDWVKVREVAQKVREVKKRRDEEYKERQRRSKEADTLTKHLRKSIRDLKGGESPVGVQCTKTNVEIVIPITDLIHGGQVIGALKDAGLL